MENFTAGMMLLVIGSTFQGQSTVPQNNTCKPQIFGSSKSANLRTKREGDFTGYKQAPIVIFEIDQSGAVQNVKIKRSSGSPGADKLALDEVRRWKYKSLRGCSIVQSEATIVIDFTAP
jgi:TonB family protein